MATNTLKALGDGEPQVRWSAWLCGWLVRGDYDREGYWITDRAGYRNTLLLSLTRITDTTGQVARRIVVWRSCWNGQSHITVKSTNSAAII